MTKNKKVSFLILLTVVFLFAGTAAGAEKNNSTMAMGDKLYAEGSMESLRQSVEVYKQITETDQQNYEACWKGARSCRKITRMAVIGELNDLEQICRQYGELGMEMAQRATELEPEKVEGHYYYAVNVGGYAKGANIFSILGKGLKKKAHQSLEKAYKIDRKYEGYVLLMHMGLYYEVLPWFAGRDKAKALEHYLEALRLMPADAPYRPQLHVLAGKLMLERGVEKDKARRILRETAESGIEYFSQKARQILAESG
ncbi:MAG: hypothetical protein K9J85_05360 [Desulfobacteraceae bacterium]|nr:hypothetical protein [Desulfobacteraceae bacterium]